MGGRPVYAAASMPSDQTSSAAKVAAPRGPSTRGQKTMPGPKRPSGKTRVSSSRKRTAWSGAALVHTRKDRFSRGRPARTRTGSRSPSARSASACAPDDAPADTAASAGSAPDEEDHSRTRAPNARYDGRQS